MRSFFFYMIATQVFSFSFLHGATPKTKLWNEIVSTYIDEKGGVNYIGLSKDKNLKIFIDSYKSIPKETIKLWNNKQKTAFFINLYNASMMWNILKHAQAEKIPIESSKFIHIKVNDVSVPGGNIWNGDYTVKVAGRNINLDGIEHGLIRGKDIPNGFKGLQVTKLDPRIHTAVNCAALSCPRVRRSAYTPENVDQMLTENIREFVNAQEHFRMIDDDTMYANKIVFWYYSDFDNQKPGAGSYLGQFITTKVAPEDPGLLKKNHLEENFNDKSKFSLRLSSSFDFDYNWIINDQRNQHLRSKS